MTEDDVALIWLSDQSQTATATKALQANQAGAFIESIYSGAFRQLAATIVSIDAASGELKVTDLATKKPLVIRVNSDSTMKKLPDQVAQNRKRTRRQPQGHSARQSACPPY